MIALVVEKPGKIALIEKEKPVPGNEEVLIRINYVGFCGSDLSTYLGKNPMVNYPRVPGHEISGVIEAAGRDVPSGFATGEPVTVVPYNSCGQCPACRKSRNHACQFNQTLGVQRDGAMQEYITVPWQKILRAPSLGALDLVMVEPLTVGFHAVDRGCITDSDVVAVFGCGMIGAGVIIRSALRGATVIAVDIDDHKLDLASALGAGYIINSTRTDLHEELQRLTRGNGPDVIVEAAGNPQTYRAAVEEVAYIGRVVCIGYVASDVCFPTKLFVQKDLEILGSRNATSEDFRAVISYLEKGIFPRDRLITRMVRPVDAGGAVRAWADEPGKVMKLILSIT